MHKIHYKLSIGEWMVNSQDDSRTELIELEIQISLESPNNSCCITVYAPPKPKPGLLEQAVGAATEALGEAGKEEAFSVEVRGQKVKQGDRIAIELTAGDNSGKVMTAEVQSIQSSFGLTTIVGRTGMQKLANTRLNRVYQNQSLSQIVKDLASQVAVEVGKIESGNTYSYFVAHESKNLLRHVQELAMREGMDVYFDVENKLTLQKFSKSNPDHTFYFGIDILDLMLLNRLITSEHILVYGESPVSNQGSDTWHWLAKDLKPFRSEVGEGRKLLSIQDGAVRTKDSADRFAKAKFGAIKDSSTSGRLKILGNPTVKLGDAIEIKNAQKPELNGLFKVTSVRHVFNKRDGFVSWVDFSGHGGAKDAEGLLGQLAGQLKGAIGL